MISVSFCSEKIEGEVLRLMNLIFNDNSIVSPSYLNSTLECLRFVGSVRTNTIHSDQFRPSETNIQYLEIGEIYFHDLDRLLP